MLPIALTSGEPAGIGPDLCVQLAAQDTVYPVVVLADLAMIQRRAKQLKLPVHCQAWSAGMPAQLGGGHLSIWPMSCAVEPTPGQLDARNRHYVIGLLDEAIAGVQANRYAGMVTAPVHKSVLSTPNSVFTGHTEYLQKQSGTEQVVMMLTSAQLKVALVTTHLPLGEVPGAITELLLERVIRVLHHDLQHRFNCADPRILVCGLNPHAGEDGQLGQEEQTIIIPTLNRLRDQGFSLVGPLPADTLFTPKVLQDADVVLAMYHDQGLPVLKYQGFGQAVNVTLGLPFVRTSVDHGTALDLAGTGLAQVGSLESALHMAWRMCTTQGKR